MCSWRLCLTHRGAAIARTIPGKANLNSLMPDVPAVCTHAHHPSDVPAAYVWHSLPCSRKPWVGVSGVLS
eukprot:3520015-Amphidinium_carterae.1